jgi:hypothetical protein
MHFDATLSVLFLRLPRPFPSHVDHDPGRIVPRISFFALQHIRMREPFFSLPLSRKRRRNVALILRSLTLGFGYPLDEMVWLSHPWECLSIPNALGLRSSEPSSSRAIEKPFQAPLSAPALSGKTDLTLPRRSSGFLPPRKPCPCLLPESLARVGTVALLSFPTSQALPLSTLGRELLLPFRPLAFL